MVDRTAWVLNLDADDELARPEGYSPSRSMRERVRSMAVRIPGLLREGDVVLAEDPDAWRAVDPGFATRFVRAIREVANGGDPAVSRGRAWCPTPSALARIAAAGLTVPASPPLELLRRVNHRGFAMDLAPTLPGARFVADLQELDEVVASEPFDQWLAKRPYTMAGRGRCRFACAGRDERIRRWFEKSFREHGQVWVEPRVSRELDLAAHGFVESDGSIRTGPLTCQRCDDHGAWIVSEVLAPGDLEDEGRRELEGRRDAVARALHDAGYFGPFGIDAFVWRDAHGERRLHSLCDLNARYTMGWAVGMASL